MHCCFAALVSPAPRYQKLLTPSTCWSHECCRNTCRRLDAVKVIGSDKVTEMWTRDVPLIKNEEFKAQFKAAVDAYILGDWPSAMQRLQDADAVRICHLSLHHSCALTLHAVWSLCCDVRCFACGCSLQLLPNDSPTRALMDTISRIGTTDARGRVSCPAGWQGWRRLDRK